MRRTARFILVYLKLIVGFIFAMTLVYSLPQDRILENVEASLPRLKSEGIYPQPFIDSESYQLDNLTNAIMLDTAIVTGDRSAFQNAIGSYNRLTRTIPGGSPIVALERMIQGMGDPEYSYAYYWHGYQTLLRPALLRVSIHGHSTSLSEPDCATARESYSNPFGATC